MQKSCIDWTTQPNTAQTAKLICINYEMCQKIQSNYLNKWCNTLQYISGIVEECWHLNLVSETGANNSQHQKSIMFQIFDIYITETVMALWLNTFQVHSLTSLLVSCKTSASKWSSMLFFKTIAWTCRSHKRNWDLPSALLHISLEPSNKELRTYSSWEETS
jgi:hypothetical protein